MNKTSQNSTCYIRYKDIAKQRARECYAKNKEKIKESQRERYKNLSFEEKKKLVEKRKEWFNKQTEEKQDEMRRKAREHSENRYHNHIIVVNQIFDLARSSNVIVQLPIVIDFDYSKMF